MTLEQIADLVRANAVNLDGEVVIRDDHVIFHIAELSLFLVTAKPHPDGRIHELCDDYNSSVLYTADEYAQFLRCDDDYDVLGEAYPEGAS
jgi:hypothetical protein